MYWGEHLDDGLMDAQVSANANPSRRLIKLLWFTGLLSPEPRGPLGVPSAPGRSF